MIIKINEFDNLNLANKVVGVTSGCYDLLHYYHLNYLERCRAYCDFLIVGVDSDLLLEKNKNKKPIIPEHHRIAMVDALKCVDASFILHRLDNLHEIAKRCNKLFKNSMTVYGSKVVEYPGVELVLIQDIIEVDSTTKIIEKIRESHEQKS